MDQLIGAAIDESKKLDSCIATNGLKNTIRGHFTRAIKAAFKLGEEYGKEKKK